MLDKQNTAAEPTICAPCLLTILDWEHAAKDGMEGLAPLLDGGQHQSSSHAGTAVSQSVLFAPRCTASKACELAAWVGGFKSLFMVPGRSQSNV
jgi:hypothetical protein